MIIYVHLTLSNLLQLFIGLVSTEVLWGVCIISSQVFGHLRSFKGWMQIKACNCKLPRDISPVAETEKQIET